MDTNDPEILKAVRSKNLFQIEFIDRACQKSASRERFIGFIMKEPKAPGGVKFTISEFNVNYRFSTEVDSKGNMKPIPSNRDIDVHFIVPVYELDDHLKTFLHKIKKGSKVSFIITIDQGDANLYKLGLEMHTLMGWVGSDAYQIFSWVGEPHKSPVQFPRFLKFSTMPPVSSKDNSGSHMCCAKAGFTHYNYN